MGLRKDPCRMSGERWEVERDRFGILFSGPLGIGECIEVVPASTLDSYKERVEELEGAIRLHQDEKSNGRTANMDFADDRLYAALTEQEKGERCGGSGQRTIKQSPRFTHNGLSVDVECPGCPDCKEKD